MYYVSLPPNNTAKQSNGLDGIWRGCTVAGITYSMLNYRETAHGRRSHSGVSRAIFMYDKAIMPSIRIKPEDVALF